MSQSAIFTDRQEVGGKSRSMYHFFNIDSIFQWYWYFAMYLQCKANFQCNLQFWWIRAGKFVVGTQQWVVDTPTSFKIPSRKLHVIFKWCLPKPPLSPNPSKGGLHHVAELGEGRGGLGQCWLLQLVGDELDRTCLSSCLCCQVETHTGIAHQSLVQVDQEHLGKSFDLNETIYGNYLFEWW